MLGKLEDVPKAEIQRIRRPSQPSFDKLHTDGSVIHGNQVLEDVKEPGYDTPHVGPLCLAEKRTPRTV